MDVKYRVWRTDDKKMYGPDLPFLMYTDGIIPSLSGAAPLRQYPISEAVLMQFTGFRLNGVDIYDKDVIRFTYPVQSKKRKPKKQPFNDMVVSWNKKRGQWCVFWQNDAGELQYQSLASALDENHAVIGNAYQNPELVK